MNIFLVGFTSSGKSTFGKEVARLMNLQFIDIDDAIRDEYGCSVQEIFEKEGEMELRKKEMIILQKIVRMDNILVSTGGGTPCFYDNMQLMNSRGLTIYLKASPNLLFERLKDQAKNRPLTKHKNEKELYEFVIRLLEKRERYYRQAALSVDVSMVNSRMIAGIIKEHSVFGA